MEQALQDQASANEGKEAPQTTRAPAQPDNSHTCASCHKPAIAACINCEAAPNSTGGLVQTTRYCSLICQRAHWSSHKEACQAAQARQKLYETGAALRQDYLVYCECLFVNAVERGTFDDPYMILHEKDSSQHTTDAIILLYSINRSGNVETEQEFLICLIGSYFSGEMGIVIKQHLKGT